MIRKPEFEPGTVASLMGRFITEMASIGRPLGETHALLLRRLQRESIGQKLAAKLTDDDVIEHCVWRRETVAPATVMHDIAALSGVLKYASSAPAWRKDYPGVKAEPVNSAKPFLSAHGHIGKSAPRERRPSAEELAALLDYFMRPEREVGFKRQIDMARMTLWQLYSGRRVGESCALLWADWNRDDRTILVRKMKDPRRKNKSKLVALPSEAQSMLEALWEIRDQNEPRIFPYRSKSVSAAYTHAKKPSAATPEGIPNLRLHDSRRECCTRLVEMGYTIEQVIQVSGHETPAVAGRVYVRQNAAKFKEGPLGQRPAAT